MSELKFATRLNSFASGAHLYWPEQKGKPTVPQMIERAATVKGLTHLDLNYPQHMTGDIKMMRQKIEDVGLAVNGMQMRWDAPEFKIGAFTHPDPKIRRQAIELTKRGIDAGREFGAGIMTLWMGQDGFDYCFQADYKKYGKTRSARFVKWRNMHRISTSALSTNRTNHVLIVFFRMPPRAC
jgi:xylose isomerase